MDINRENSLVYIVRGEKDSPGLQRSLLRPMR